MSIRIASLVGLLLLAACRTDGGAPSTAPALPLPAEAGVPPAASNPPPSTASAPVAPVPATTAPRGRSARVESLVPSLPTIPIVDIAPIQDALTASAREAGEQPAETPAASTNGETSGGLF